MPNQYTPGHQSVVRICQWCGKAFTAKPSQVKRTGAKFCSTPCGRANRWSTPVDERLRVATTITDTCWLMTIGLDKDGYGRLKVDGLTRKAHHIAWWLVTGDWPKRDEAICHTCDVRNCVRNDDVGTYEGDGVAYPRRGHLWLGTPPANNHDRTLKGRTAAGDTHAWRLHPELVLRGDRNGARKHPERMARGARNGSRLHPERLVRGEQHARAKLTDDQVREIRRRYANRKVVKVTQNQLAAEYGVPQSTISAIILGKTWKHLL